MTNVPEQPSAAREVAEIVARFRFLSSEAYVRDGEEVAFDPNVSVFGRAPPGYPPIVAEVTKRMYDRCYTRPSPEPGNVYVEDKFGRQLFLQRLHAANATTTSWSAGWRVKEARENHVVLESGTGEALLAGPNDYRSAGTDGTAQVRLQKGSATIQPGWYHFRGNDALPAGRPPVTRVYWNLCTAGAVPFVRTITERFNEARVPFMAKTLSDPQAFSRSDAGVLYLLSSSWREALGPLAEAQGKISKYLKSSTPMFTLRLGDGLSLAESPQADVDEGFGMHRCRIVATSLWDAHARGVTDPQGLTTAVIEGFGRAGIDLTRPYVNPGSTREYGVALATRRAPLVVQEVA